MNFQGRKHNFDEKTWMRIEHLLPRLKYSVLPSQIIKWLENFEEKEIDSAIDLLSVFEYIPFNEFMFRIDGLLFEILKDIPKGQKILIFPYGKVGKSGTLVTYPLSHTNAYINRKDDILISHDIQFITDLHEYKTLIFIDDFIGSGQTFIEEYKKIQWIKNWKDNNQVEKTYLLSAIIMNDGAQKINFFDSSIKIKAEERFKIFQNGTSPLTAYKNILSLKSISLKYGRTLNHLNSLGYSDGQSMVAFFHGTPDNTLPIIWEHIKWNPIYPRDANTRMDYAREFKQNIAFYLGVFNKLGIDIFTGKSIFNKLNDRYKRKIENNTKYAHSIIALLFLKQKGYDNIIISQLLGLTREELKRVYLEARMKGLIDINYAISINGFNFLQDKKIKPN